MIARVVGLSSLPVPETRFLAINPDEVPLLLYVVKPDPVHLAAVYVLVDQIVFGFGGDGDEVSAPDLAPLLGIFLVCGMLTVVILNVADGGGSLELNSGQDIVLILGISLTNVAISVVGWSTTPLAFVS